MPAPIPLEQAAAAAALYERDGNASRVALIMDMPRTTVNDVVKGYGRWGEVATDSSFVALRQEQKRLLQAASALNMSRAQSQIADTIHKCSAPQAAMVFGILFDKDRLMAGESTQNVAVRGPQLTNLDDLANALRGELVKRSGGTSGGIS